MPAPTLEAELRRARPPAVATHVRPRPRPRLGQWGCRPEPGCQAPEPWSAVWLPSQAFISLISFEVILVEGWGRAPRDREI